ncbi:MAG TPA: V-type ATP synthase subunit K [Kiritimatiellia bacterium]|nr:V-type ATP synthase subunit K [Kiritimatiellia bacterium]
MDADTIVALSKAGGAAALGLAAVGSSIGAGLAGSSAIGAWKKCYAQSKAAPFILITFIGAPLSQTIYGMILMGWMVTAAGDPAIVAKSWATMLIGGICGGLGMGVSAWFQGKAGAAGADALAETGQGFGNYLMTLGVIETVALFVLVFIRSSFAG